MVYLIKVFEKNTQFYLFLHPVFYVLSMNTQKLLKPLIKYMHENLQQVNREEYSQKIDKSSFHVSISLNKT